VGSTIAAWLAKEGVGLLLGALAKLILDGLNEYRADQALKRTGRLEAANEANVKTMETQDAVESVARPSDDAVVDSMRSGRF
jgi:hypothetical protein